jgi:hypothetical protein
MVGNVKTWENAAQGDALWRSLEDENFIEVECYGAMGKIPAKHTVLYTYGCLEDQALTNACIEWKSRTRLGTGSKLLGHRLKDDDPAVRLNLCSAR